MAATDELSDLEPFPDWATICPELVALEDNVDTIRAELDAIRGGDGWFPWVQRHLYDATGDWDVFPFFGMDKLLVENARRVPETCQLLAQIPSLKTALFSCLSPGAAIHPHVGPPALSNFTLRCHLGLIVPVGCSLSCGGRTCDLEAGKLLMFDDLLEHHARNSSSDERYMLICDIERPEPRPYDLPVPVWGKNLPEWPSGWENIRKHGSFVPALTLGHGLEACGMVRGSGAK